MSATQLFVLGTLLASGVSVSADLRMASQPRAGFRVKQRNPVQFVAKTALYMEPSDFQYNGLRQQRNNAYDNFLRSNIDNEQDKRNFNNEAGRDMLPFRSFEAAALDTSGTVRNKIPDGAPGPVITATPGEPYIVPLRWNNPHASELEVNVWISNNQYVVPIRKPTCSGEGHQDNVFAFTIPADFNQLGAKVPGWTGCKQEGDCVLQIYAHSVEPRTYAIGTPLVVTGDVPAPTATSTQGIESARADVGLELNKLTRDLCLSSADPAADIPTAIPRAARLVSDQFNHAYQNSDYSPYSGQQPEAISRNLQASSIISMIPANQGELGGKLFKQTNPQGAALQQKLKAKVDKLVKAYEGVVNKLIGRIGDKTMQNTGELGAGGVQKLAKTFRALETGSVTTKRLKTNTYVPSFQLLTQQDISNARALVPGQYRGLIDAQGQVRLYEAVLNDLKGDFQRAAARGLVYQPAMIKQSASTMQDPTAFKKRNAQGRKDGGIYAAQQALETKKAAAKALEMKQTFIIADVPSVVDNPLSSFSADDELPDTGAEEVEIMPDTHGVNPDMDCDDDTLDVTTCTPPAGPLFVQSAEDPDEGLVLASTQNSNSAMSTVANGVILCIVSTIGAFFTA